MGRTLDQVYLDQYNDTKLKLSVLAPGETHDAGHVRVKCLGSGARGLGRFLVTHDDRQQAMGLYSAASYAASMSTVEVL